MAWLADWLKQVILIILLAAFVDLLLPSQAMQRYVRTVISLFLLLTLLTPVFELFQRSWDADELMAQAERLEAGGRSGQNGRAGAALKSLDSILAGSRQMQADNTTDAKKLAESQLAEQMKAGIGRTVGAGVQVADIQVTIDTEQKGGPAIQSVQVILSYTKQDPEKLAAGPKGQEKEKGFEPVKVERVKPVTVTVQPGAEAAEAATRATERDSPQGEELRALCIRYMEKDWDVPRQRLAVRITGGEG